MTIPNAFDDHGTGPPARPRARVALALAAMASAFFAHGPKAAVALLAALPVVFLAFGVSARAAGFGHGKARTKKGKGKAVKAGKAARPTVPMAPPGGRLRR